MEVSVGGWMLCRCVDGRVGRWVVVGLDVWANVSVGGWW